MGFLDAMDRLRAILGPAQITKGAGRTQRSEEDRRADLKALKMVRVTNPDGSTFLVPDTSGPTGEDAGDGGPEDPTDGDAKR